MKYISRPLLIVLVLLGILESCSSGETTTLSSLNDKVSPNLVDKIVETATSVNDYNLINKNCPGAILSAHFLNKQGVYYGPFAISVSNWDIEFADIKNRALRDIEVNFNGGDLVIDAMYEFSLLGPGALYARDDFSKYFEDCSFEGNFKSLFVKEAVSVSDVNFNCSGNVQYYVEPLFLGSARLSQNPIPLNSGEVGIENALLSYNQNSFVKYTTDDLRVVSIELESSESSIFHISGAEKLTNYFKDCEINYSYTSDCVNFKYPFIINKINLQTEEITPMTITGDNDLSHDFFNTFENLRIVYPITMETLNGTNILVNSDEELEGILTDSSKFCADNW